jgi:FlaA1/EpsC-like NDP-sugar epimerase
MNSVAEPVVVEGTAKRLSSTTLPLSLVRYRRVLVITLHLALIPVCYALAFLIRFDGVIPVSQQQNFWVTLPLLMAARLGAFASFRLFHGWWRHVSMHDLVELTKAITLSSVVFVVVLFMVEGIDELPRSILVLDWLVAMGVFGGMRFGVRGIREGWVGRERFTKGKRTLIIGAGEATDGLLRQLRRKEDDSLHPLALVDDDPAKQGMRLHGVRVCGTVDDLDDIVKSYGIQLVVIAVPSATPDQMRRIVDRCMETQVEFKIVPRLEELIDGRSRIEQLRKVEINDLLGRPPIRLKLKAVQDDLRNKVVMVTGGAGSIGSELARQIASFSPKQLVLVEQAESPLYFVHLELTRLYPELDVVPLVGDITDAGRMGQVFSVFRPDYVFHAAAYKHVPMMERNVVEAVRNNVLGTLQLAECAARHEVRKFVLISTDKAVRPSSVMGATKRISERIVLGWPTLRRSKTDFRAVRFGNVLGSDGSVIPLFKQQLASGQPLTVTHPEMTRYFMTIPEAVQLVLQAASLPEAAGHISMLEMGQPMRILELAENLIRLSGLEPYRDVPIIFTGMRPGEKLHEELMSQVEVTVPTTVDKIRVVQTDEPNPGAVREGLERLAAAVALATPEDILSAIRTMVPECVEPLRVAEVRTSAPLAIGEFHQNGAGSIEALDLVS